MALQYQAYNEWSAKSAEAISKLEREAYPITGQDGVEVEHQKLKFFLPAPVTDINVVKQRVKARKAVKDAAKAAAAPAPATTPKVTE